MPESERVVLKTVSQSQIDHVIILKLAQTGISGVIEGHISWGDLPVVADPLLCQDLRNYSFHQYA